MEHLKANGTLVVSVMDVQKAGLGSRLKLLLIMKNRFGCTRITSWVSQHIDLIDLTVVLNPIIKGGGLSFTVFAKLSQAPAPALLTG